MCLWEEDFCKLNEKHLKVTGEQINYGTAGFRTKSEKLDHVIFRMGILATLRSKVRKATIGVMITASHNPVEDNGVKLVDPMGEMLEPSWEKYASKIANLNDEDVLAFVKNFILTLSIEKDSQSGRVVLACDTRPSSESLALSLKDGIHAMKGQFTDYGILTTPQLHFMVRCINTANIYGQPSEEGYYSKLSSAFKQLMNSQGPNKNYTRKLVLDGANGVGALKMRKISHSLGNSIQVEICNDGSQGKLNFQCGADYVKVQQKFPDGVTIEPGIKGCSFDGDADRIVYFYQDQQMKFNLLDGDKIATLFAGFLKHLVKKSGMQLNFGIVQTAYANGSSTKYITEQLNVPVACVPTGVKHLHHKAQEFDIGVYFEANGHGTVLFSDHALQKIKESAINKSDNEQHIAATQLEAVVDLINQTVGDAISDLLLVEVILNHNGWSIEDWNQSYTDLPNRQLKVRVKDRNVIKTTDAERKTVSPEGLQPAIDELVTKFPLGRSFVRPSGTEDVVRVYAESNTQANADILAYKVSILVYEMAGGAGDKPKL